MTRRIGISSRWGKRLSPLVGTATVIAGLVAMTGQAAASTVTADTGSAYGVYANITLFGGPQPPYGPLPMVTLPSGGSPMITSTAPSETVAYGPATLFDSGTEKVTTKGTIGSVGSVTSTTSILGRTQPAGTCPGTQTSCVYGGQFTATSMTSSCKATTTAVTGKAGIVGGKLVTQTDTNGNPTKTVTIPASPAANYTVNGYLYLSSTDKETFTWIFNEHTVTNGTLTVNAGHQQLHGPTAVGDLIVGQSVCGVTVA